MDLTRIWSSKGKKVILSRKECKSCGEILDIGWFDVANVAPDKHFDVCRKCINVRNNYKTDSPIVTMSEFNKRKRINKNKRKKKSKKKRKRIIKHPEFRLLRNISGRIGKTLCLAKNKESNGTTIKDKFGYSIEKLKKHLENQFTDDMNWNNYGEYWEIDHIKPLSLFDSLQDKQAWRLKNLQPLKSYENSKKGDSFNS
ncbi:MAG: HNH endonuclease signature motif containing protein [Bacteroidales bacterium]